MDDRIVAETTQYAVEYELGRTLRIGSNREGWRDDDTFVKGAWCSTGPLMDELAEAEKRRDETLEEARDYRGASGKVRIVKLVTVATVVDER